MLQWEGFAEKGFKSGMKERVGDDEKLISVAVRGINYHIRLYSQMLSLYSTAALTRQEHRAVPPNANPAVWILIRVVV